jgi:excisionase family DNA binding protein
MITVHELAERLKVRENTVYRWVRGQRIRPVRMGRSIRFNEADIETLERIGMPKDILIGTDHPVKVLRRPRRKGRIWEPV